ncbi:MAG: 2OG-Fe(II) oxygenase [Halioglobus sp.]
MAKKKVLRRDSIESELVLTMDPCFTQEELGQLRSLVEQNSRVAGIETSGNLTYASMARRSRILRLDVIEYKWVFAKLWKVAKRANFSYGFDIDGLREQIQLAIYDESEKGFFGWHMDCSASLLSRKISISMPMCEPDDYEGGDLEFLLGSGDPLRVEQAMGAVVTFPSFLMHRVTPVTKGTRYSLVCWVHGPGWV